MLLQFLGFVFVAFFWLLAAKGLIEALAPFTRRLTLLASRMEPRPTRHPANNAANANGFLRAVLL